MKPGIPWSVKGIEPEVREAAKHAARRSGMTLGEWLNTVILDQADESAAPPAAPGVPFAHTDEPPPAARSENTIRLEDIAQQLSRLAQREQEAAAIRPYASPAVQRHDNEMLARILSRVDSNERQAVEAFTAMNERLTVLGRQVAGRPPGYDRPEDVPGFQALETALRNIVDHMEVSERRTRDGLKSMQDRMGEMAQRAVTAASDDVVKAAPAIASLEARLNELAVRVQRNEAAASQGISEDMRREIGDLTARIDGIAQHAQELAVHAQAAAGDTAQRELREIEARIQSLLEETQAAMNGQQAGSAELARLRSDIAGLGQRIEEVRSGTATDRDVNALRVAVEQLSVRTAQGPDLRPLADMDRRLVDLARRLEESEDSPRQLPQLGELERRIAELDHRLAEAVKREGDGQAMAALERQIGDVNERIGRTEQQMGHLDTIERAITQLFDGLEQHRAQTARSIDEAARHASEYGQPPLAGSPEIRALEEGLRAVRDSADQSDRRSQETLEAVHETLEQIVVKLAELETATAGHQLAAAMSEQAQAGNRAPAYAAPAVDWQPPAAPLAAPVAAPVVREAQPQLAMEVDGGQPPRDLPPVPHAAPEEMSLSADDEFTGDDFIAAARRAAQAAASRSTVSPPMERPPIKTGANSRFGFLIPFRKAPPRKPAPVPVASGPQQIPILKAPGSNDNRRRRLILVGIVLLAAASAFTFNLLTRNGWPHPAPAPASELAPQPSKTVGEDSRAAPAVPVAASAAADDGDITGSLPEAAKTDASLSSLVAEPGAPSGTAEMPPAAAGTEALRRAAADGDPRAQFIVAGRYLDGEGLEADVTKAAYWYQQAASRGLAPAQYRIATLFERGKGVPKDVATAQVWYERAAAGGNVKAMHNAAVIAAGNEAGTPDYGKAFRLFKDAAQHGLQDSQFNLAVLYERGLGAEPDSAEAMFWYLVAARNNDADATARAARMAENLKPEAAAGIRARAERWSPLPTLQDANVVAIADDSWKSPAVAVTAPAAPPAPPAAAPAPAAEPLSLNPVKAVQQLLMKLGFNVGEPDGRMGTRTANAIRLFQLQSGLKVTGEVSPELIDAMQAKAAKTDGA